MVINSTNIYKKSILYHPNSLNTRKTTTSTKRTIIYRPNKTPWTQETPRHLQNEQSPIILTPWTQERPIPFSTCMIYMEYPLFNTKFLLLINFRFKSDLVFKPHYVHTHSRLNVNYMWFRNWLSHLLSFLRGKHAW
jgi:hypothetical protein